MAEISPPSLWKLFSQNRETGQEHRAYVIAGSFKAATALWPNWQGQGSGECVAGPKAYGHAQYVEVIALPSPAPEEVRRRAERARPSRGSTEFVDRGAGPPSGRGGGGPWLNPV